MTGRSRTCTRCHQTKPTHDFRLIGYTLTYRSRYHPWCYDCELESSTARQRRRNQTSTEDPNSTESEQQCL